MPTWTGNKVNPSDINGGEQYKGGDRLSREAVNAIVNNSIYASEKSDEALEKANSAFMANGTIASVGGVPQPFLSFDSDPQTQIDGLITRNEFNSQMAKSTKIEVVYDSSSQDSSLNWGKHDGIMYNEVVSNKDLSKYKMFIVTLRRTFYGTITYFTGICIKGDNSNSFMSYFMGDYFYEVRMSINFNDNGFTNKSAFLNVTLDIKEEETPIVKILGVF